jgi:hypothetical protein
MDAWDTDRFWAMVEIAGPDECWLWKGGTSGKGYGRFKIRGKLYSSHRVAYEIHNGKLKNLHQYHGTVVRHSCDSPGCCNGKHLLSGSQLQNVRDMDARGRRAIAVWMTIPDEKIVAIRQATGTNLEIGGQFGVSPTYVSEIRRVRYRKGAVPPLPPLAGEGL